VSLRRAPVTYLLLAAIAAVFLAETVLGGSRNTQVLVLLGANVPRLVEAGQWWRLVASTFLHVGLLHLLFNGWALYQLGQLFEVWMGSVWMTVVYFASGIAGSAASVLFLSNPNTVSAGASGAIFGLLGALIAFLLRRHQRLTPAAKSLLLQLAFWAVLNVILGFNLAGIDDDAHLGGCLAGLLFGWGLRPRWERGAS
jgi:rhomboid protease GluP